MTSGLGRDAGAPLVSHPHVDKIAFTGSNATGSKIMTSAAQLVKPICSATSRLLVHESIAAEFLDKLVKWCKNIKTSDPLEEGCRLGPVVSSGQYEKVMKFISIAKDEGATILCGGEYPRHLKKGYYIKPAIITDVKTSMQIWREEVFGSVLCVKTFKIEDEAIELANDTQYGLAAAVLSQDLERGDVNTDTCQQCVETGTSEVLQRCPKQKRATIWYDYCTLRYSNESLFSRPEQSVTSNLTNMQNITDEPERFRQVLGETLNEIVSKAVNNNPSNEKFATKIAKFTASVSLYTLAQCMPYLTSGECDFCLKSAIPILRTCCDNKKGGRVIGESCNIRYEVYSFFGSTVAPAPPHTPNSPPIQPSLPSPSSTSQGNGGISKLVIIAIVVPIAVSFVCLFIIRCFLTRRTRKKAYYAFNEENGFCIDPNHLED
ncbi:unnamed protein product [Fraxinus pennsylvanica]|uniref:Gnk2-homologous domain-containing protein n=1 Tax=Fraxinus pennsylvanica TaxID=56036 RepID=A0AAD1ZU79_9LAMI|nr:unnamed protein product [Fraxinus pennsylvanica]